VRAVVCQQLGPLDDLVIEDRQSLAPGPDEAVIDVRAAGVNYVDGLICQGRYQIKPPTPFVPGSEIAGEVAVVGEAVHGVAAGDRVIAMTGFGGFADQVAVPAASVIAIPENLTFGQAAALIQSYSTALFTMTRRTSVAPDEWVLCWVPVAVSAWRASTSRSQWGPTSSPPRRAPTSWRPPARWAPRRPSPMRTRI